MFNELSTLAPKRRKTRRHCNSQVKFMKIHDLACPKPHISSSNIDDYFMCFQDPLLDLIFLNLLATLSQNWRFREPLRAQLGPKWHPKSPNWHQKAWKKHKMWLKIRPPNASASKFLVQSSPKDHFGWFCSHFRRFWRILSSFLIQLCILLKDLFKDCGDICAWLLLHHFHQKCNPLNALPRASKELCQIKVAPHVILKNIRQ